MLAEIFRYCGNCAALGESLIQVTVALLCPIAPATSLKPWFPSYL
jgi:hypothetical protein